jgi:hypothetical protein
MHRSYFLTHINDCISEGRTFEYSSYMTQGITPAFTNFPRFAKYLYSAQPFQYIVTIPSLYYYLSFLCYLPIFIFPILISGRWMGEYLNTAFVYNSGATQVYSLSFNRGNPPLARSWHIEVSVLCTAHPSYSYHFTHNMLFILIFINNNRE